MLFRRSGSEIFRVPLKIRVFDFEAQGNQQRRTKNRSICGINEDSSMMLTLPD